MRGAVFAALILGCAPRSLPATLSVDAGAPAVDLPSADVPAPRDVPGTIDVAAPQDVPTTDGAPPGDVADDRGAPVDAPPRALRVLFIGNSYTYYFDLPNAVARIAAESAREPGRPTITVDSVVEGGATLQRHWAAMRQDRVRMGPWDAVVLQGQSVEPVAAYAGFDAYARRFAEVIREVGARTVYYATWARRPGDVVYQQSWSGGSFAAMTTRLDAAYRMTAMNTMGAVAPVGLRWADARAMRPALELYDADGSHPSAAGSFLAACVIYRALTGFAPSAAVAPPMGVSADDAAFLRGITVRD